MFSIFGDFVARQEQSLELVELEAAQRLAASDLVEGEVEVLEVCEVAYVLNLLEQILVQFEVHQIGVRVQVLDLLDAARDENELFEPWTRNLQILELLDAPALDVDLLLVLLQGVVD